VLKRAVVRNDDPKSAGNVKQFSSYVFYLLPCLFDYMVSNSSPPITSDNAQHESVNYMKN